MAALGVFPEALLWLHMTAESTQSPMQQGGILDHRGKGSDSGTVLQMLYPHSRRFDHPLQGLLSTSNLSLALPIHVQVLKMCDFS